MDMMRAMGAMQDPQGTMMSYMMQGMIAQHPEEWKKAQEQLGGRDRGSQIEELRKLYKSRGMDLDATARQWGIRL